MPFQFQNWGPGISEDYASCGAPTKASDGDVKTNTGKERGKRKGGGEEKGKRRRGTASRPPGYGLRPHYIGVRGGIDTTFP